MKRALVVIVLVACGKQAKSTELPPACELSVRILDQYIECRRTNPRSLPAEILVDYQRSTTKLWHDVVASRGASKAARMCSFQIDHLRADMAGEDCVPQMTDADRAVVAEARVRVTPAPRASNAESQAIVDAYAARRDATCKCTDQACVDALTREVDALPLEKLQSEGAAVHDAFDAIGVETYDCATRTSILSPDRWQRVK